jgi:hypothetical protein
MRIQLIDINRSGHATYRVEGRLYLEKIALSTKMIQDVNPDFKGSLGDAKFKTHLEPTIAKFHPLKNQ